MLGGTTLDFFTSNGDGTFAFSQSTLGASFGTPPSNTWVPIVGDFNGDGRNDFVMFGGTDVDVFLSSNSATDLISSVTTGLGATTSIAYAPLTNNSVYTKATGDLYPLQDIQLPFYVVSQSAVSNGVGATYSASYAYAGAKLDLSGRGFLGFSTMTITDPQTGIVQTASYQQSFPFIGLTASLTKTIATGSGTQTLGQAVTTYQFTDAAGAATLSSPTNSGAPYQVSVAKTVASSADLDGSVLPTVTTTYQYDNLGNATQIVVSTPDGASKTTTNTYTNDTTNWFLGRLTGATVTSTLP
jgi:hypothetical protein